MTSFLATPEQTRGALDDAGFETLVFRDTTEAIRDGYAEMRRRLEAEGLPPLGPARADGRADAGVAGQLGAQHGGGPAFRHRGIGAAAGAVTRAGSTRASGVARATFR